MFDKSRLMVARERTTNNTGPAAIVIGVDCLQGLQSARILAGRGLRVIGIAKSSKHYGTRTRACDEVLIADTGGDGLIDLLTEIGPGFSAKPVLYPCQDKNVIVLSRHQSALAEWYHIMLPEPEVVEMMMDKAAFYSYAQSSEFPLTPTYLLHERDDAEQAAGALRYPAIVKPSLRLREWSKHTTEKAFVVTNAEQLLRQYDRLRGWADVLIAQELIQGPDTNHFTCNCYFGESGLPLVTFTTQKLRQWPPATGQACLSQEVRNDEVVSETVRLFQSVGYRGLAYLEMKKDERSGKYFIVEPNIGRPTGRAASAEAAGVELLYTMYCDAVGLPLPEARTQQYLGIKWIHLLRDTQAALYHLRRRELTFMEWRRSIRGPRVNAIMSWRDPMPFLAALYGALPGAIAAKRRT